MAKRTRTGRVDSGRVTRKRKNYRGIPVVPGIAIGRVHLKFREIQELSDKHIEASEVGMELERLHEAVRISKEQLMVDRRRVARAIGELEATIFDTHIALFEDRTLIGAMRNDVADNLRPVEVVVSEIIEGYYKTLSLVEDEHIRERAADIRDVGRRLLNNLTALEPAGLSSGRNDSHVPTDQYDIVFARELLPSDIATLAHRKTIGVISETGNDRGHCAVLLRAMNIPCVMGIDGIAEILKDGDLVIIDGSSGQVLINPKDDVINDYQERQKTFSAWRELLDKDNELPAVTEDGEAIRLLTNISQTEELSLLRMYNADGVGLYRTEFELMTRATYPDENTQFELYKSMVEEMGGKPITFRTMDIGSEKELAYLDLPREENHALGRRSIRLVRELEDYQLVQLRAIMRAAQYGDVRLLFPFITNVEDMRYARRLTRLAARSLENSGQKYKKDLPVGMMIEVPTAAMSLTKFIREAQFFSVGTNDLTQYMCAADRNHKDVASWYAGYNPGVLALLKEIVDAANSAKRPVTICGEMAGSPLYTMFLLGIGVRQLSMSAPSIPLVKRMIRSVSIKGAERLANKALTLPTTTQVRDLFTKTVEKTLGRDIASWL